jgi:hypothetical protein
MALSPVDEGTAWQVALPGLPPGEDVAYAIHGGFDVKSREGQTPVWEIVVVAIGGQTAFGFGTSLDSFPVWRDYQSHARTSDDGVLRLELLTKSCRTVGLNQPSVCSIDGSSTFTATLLNSQGWLAAPACE